MSVFNYQEPVIDRKPDGSPFIAAWITVHSEEAASKEEADKAYMAWLALNGYSRSHAAILSPP
jgi:hypothetical protein